MVGCSELKSTIECSAAAEVVVVGAAVMNTLRDAVRRPPVRGGRYQDQVFVTHELDLDGTPARHLPGTCHVLQAEAIQLREGSALHELECV